MSESNAFDEKRYALAESISELLFRCFPLDWPADGYKWNI